MLKRRYRYHDKAHNIIKGLHFIQNLWHNLLPPDILQGNYSDNLRTFSMAEPSKRPKKLKMS